MLARGAAFFHVVVSILVRLLSLQWGVAAMPRTSRRVRLLLIVVGIMLWLPLAPVAIAFGGCVGMGASCHGPCLLTSYELPTVSGLTAFQAVEPLQEDPPVSLPAPDLKVPTPPPRSVLFSS